MVLRQEGKCSTWNRPSKPVYVEYSAQCSEHYCLKYSVHCTLYTVHCTLYSIVVSEVLIILDVVMFYNPLGSVSTMMQHISRVRNYISV